MIRLILIAIFLILFLLISIPIQLVERLIGKKWPMARDISSLRIVQWAFKVVAWLSGVRLTVRGEENVPKDQPVLYVGNHRSYFDIILTYARTPLRTGYVAKKEMLRYPVLRTWMKMLYCLFLDRDDIRQGLQTILTAIEYVKDGISICIFPEGTRNKNDSELDLLPFHDASFKIAQRTDCPIIPVAISNSAQIFEAHMPWVKKTHVVLEYGQPIYIKDLDKEARKHPGLYMQHMMKEMLEKNQVTEGQ